MRTNKQKRPLSPQEIPLKNLQNRVRNAIIVTTFKTYLLGVHFQMASKREKIKLKSSKSTFMYHTTKNKTSTPERITLKKFDPIVREHVEFKETK